MTQSSSRTAFITHIQALCHVEQGNTGRNQINHVSVQELAILDMVNISQLDQGFLLFQCHAHTCIWSILYRAAFAVWILANGLIGSNTFFAGIFLLGTGTLQLMAIIVYSSRQPDNFSIRIDDGNNQPLHLRYDGMYWTTLFSGETKMSEPKMLA